MSEKVALWLTAIGTVGAVIVALFGEYLRPWLHGPRLKLCLREPKGERVKSIVTPPAGDPNPSREDVTRWYHVLVSNRRSRSPATRVQVFLSRVEEYDDEYGEFRTTWTGDIPLQWRYQGLRPLTETIGGNIADCDLFHVLREKWLELNPQVQPVGLKLRWRVGECPIRIIMSLQARSIEGVTPLTRFRIEWDGKWYDNEAEMWEHLTVKIVR